MSKDKLISIVLAALAAWGGFVGKQIWDQNTEITVIKTKLESMEKWRLARDAGNSVGRTR